MGYLKLFCMVPSSTLGSLLFSQGFLRWGSWRKPSLGDKQTLKMLLAHGRLGLGAWGHLKFKQGKPSVIQVCGILTNQFTRKLKKLLINLLLVSFICQQYAYHSLGYSSQICSVFALLAPCLSPDSMAANPRPNKANSVSLHSVFYFLQWNKLSQYLFYLSSYNRKTFYQCL